MLVTGGFRVRLAGRGRLGFYPLPIPEAERIHGFLAFPDKQCCALDPCVGDGAAFDEITSDKRVVRYGVELDAGRGEQAGTQEALFQIQLPNQPGSAASLGLEAQCFRGSVVVPGRKRRAWHLVAVSAELAKTKPGVDRDSARTVLCDDDPVFVLYRCCLAIWTSSCASVGSVVFARAQSTKGDPSLDGTRMLTRAGEREQAYVSQMDWQGPQRASHPNSGRERINLLESA
jgi:hypothetical protein